MYLFLLLEYGYLPCVLAYKFKNFLVPSNTVFLFLPIKILSMVFKLSAFVSKFFLSMSPVDSFVFSARDKAQCFTQQNYHSTFELYPEL